MITYINQVEAKKFTSFLLGSPSLCMHQGIVMTASACHVLLDIGIHDLKFYKIEIV